MPGRIPDDGPGQFRQGNRAGEALGAGGEVKYTNRPQGAHFWSSTAQNSYIEPKRDFQAIGIVDFVQPFLIQSMDKPGFKTINTAKVTKFLKNGTIRTENHYKTGYELNSISMSIIDSHELGRNGGDLNKADTLYDLLTNGGYTYRSNELGASPSALRFASIQILELSPVPSVAAKGNMAASLVGGQLESRVSALMFGARGAAPDIAGMIKGSLNSAASSMNFLNPHVAGVWTMFQPVITSVDFGSMGYDSEDLVKIKLTLDYNNFKYEKAWSGGG